MVEIRKMRKREKNSAVESGEMRQESGTRSGRGIGWDRLGQPFVLPGMASVSRSR